MAVTSAQDLYLHELGDIYDAEQRILQILPTLANESADAQVKRAYQQHEQETRQQIQNLEQCFQALGSQPQRTPCYAIQGLKQEHDSFMKESPGDDVLTLFDLEAASKTEHYEIASYRGLIQMSQLMGQQRCVQLLQQNLQQEEAMAQTVERLGQQLGQRQIGQTGTQPQVGTQPPF